MLSQKDFEVSLESQHLPGHFQTLPLHWDHSLLHHLNETTVKLGLPTPFDNVKALQEDNGEVFLSVYFEQQARRNSLHGQERDTHQCLCSTCRTVPMPLVHTKPNKDNLDCQQKALPEIDGQNDIEVPAGLYEQLVGRTFKRGRTVMTPKGDRVQQSSRRLQGQRYAIQAKDAAAANPMNYTKNPQPKQQQKPALDVNSELHPQPATLLVAPNIAPYPTWLLPNHLTVLPQTMMAPPIQPSAFPPPALDYCFPTPPYYCALQQQYLMVKHLRGGCGIFGRRPHCPSCPKRLNSHPV